MVASSLDHCCSEASAGIAVRVLGVGEVGGCGCGGAECDGTEQGGAGRCTIEQDVGWKTEVGKTVKDEDGGHVIGQGEDG